jgi:death-on-curing protein
VRASVRWLTKPIVLKLHARSLADHGGASGLRDEGLLDTALAKPQNLAAYGDPSPFALAGAYLSGIGRAHAFVDGNKRTAFFSAYVFLGVNGYELDADEAEAAAVTVAAVTSQMSEHDLERWLEHFCRPG